MSKPTLNSPLTSPLDVIKRHKKSVILCPLCCLVLGALFYIFSPHVPERSATVLRVGRESVGIDPAATTGQTMPLYTSDRKDEVRSTQEIFRSRTVAAKVVDMLGPDVILSRGEQNPVTQSPANITKPIGWLKARVAALDPISDREAAIITVERNLFVGGEQQATMIVLRYSAQLASTGSTGLPRRR